MIGIETEGYEPTWDDRVGLWIYSIIDGFLTYWNRTGCTCCTLLVAIMLACIVFLIYATILILWR